MRTHSERTVAGSITVRFFLPAVLIVLLFVLIIFMVILPMVEERLMAGKREVIRELVESAWSGLAEFRAMEMDGRLTREQAQARAVAHMRRLRYGPERKDYFWINDMGPRMIMHPYRRDLEGRDVTGFTDPNGKHMFVECVAVARSEGAGYVNYHWQWLDDPGRIVPKISYVKAFEPWSWIIGSGIYVEDVKNEISTITNTLAMICLGLLAAIMGLSAYAVWHGIVVTREKQRAEEKARLRREQLFQAAKMVSLGTLVSGVAHEINNPVTSIMLNAPNLNRIWQAAMPVLDRHLERRGDFPIGGSSYAQLRDRLPRILDGIEADARRVRDIVTDLKDFARDKPSEMNDRVDVNEVVKKAVGLTRHLIEQSTRHFRHEYAPNLPNFNGNAQRIEQVVINLLVNACQALADKEHAVTISTEWQQADDSVVITVKDQGEGIPEPVIRQIKDPFFTTRRDEGGTGLGLAISDKIVQDHGGRLEFVSTPGMGTTARIHIPTGHSLPAENNGR